MRAADLITIVYCTLLCWFAWDSWRNLDNLQRELERHARGREIKRRVLAEVAKQKAVQL